ncbi:MAG TPA: hypothetical protein H9693_03385 [Firmicutes bacterium]|nr:hypothetical protein [Bacillota bacterium]
MKKEISEIKRRALLAKQRMKMGYWQKMQEERDRMMTVTADSSKLNLASSVRKREYEIVNKVAMGDDFAEKEEKLYVKVREILDRDENVMNPIGQLVDRTVFDKLDEANRQRYILELSAKFRELRERYYKEKTKYV